MRINGRLKITDLQGIKSKINDLQAGRSLGWTSASRSHPGRVREVNEDSCLDQPEHELWAVADGIGGHTDRAGLDAGHLHHGMRRHRC